MRAFGDDSRVVWFEGNYQDYEADRRRRLGTEADTPHRINYRKLTEVTMTADHARAIADYFAEMFDRDFANTMKVLRAVPNDRRDYKPDEKSRTAWELATHIVGADLWVLDSVCDASFVYDPEAEARRTAGLSTVDDLVRFYEREFPKRVERLRQTPGEQLATVVDFFGMEKRPSIWFLGMANNHTVHHRGQLMAYLRAMGSKVPSIYGRSADEPFQG
jgi:uncharacterized damage-inducible protein DinB